MAFVNAFVLAGRKTLSRHPTQVTCRYAVDITAGEAKLVQLDTYGSSVREIPGKVSQTLHLDEKAARKLWEILGREFKFE